RSLPNPSTWMISWACWTKSWGRRIDVSRPGSGTALSRFPALWRRLPRPHRLRRRDDLLVVGGAAVALRARTDSPCRRRRGCTRTEEQLEDSAEGRLSLGRSNGWVEAIPRARGLKTGTPGSLFVRLRPDARVQSSAS